MRTFDRPLRVDELIVGLMMADYLIKTGKVSIFI